MAAVGEGGEAVEERAGFLEQLGALGWLDAQHHRPRSPRGDGVGILERHEDAPRDEVDGHGAQRDAWARARRGATPLIGSARAKQQAGPVRVHVDARHVGFVVAMRTCRVVKAQLE